MSAKISEELSRRIKKSEAADEASTSQAELPVIVTVKKDADLEALKEQGLKIERTFDIINAVSGTLPASSVTNLAQLDEVQQIDFDGEVHVLKPEEDE